MGIAADVVCVTSADRLYRAVRARTGQGADAQIAAALELVHNPPAH